MLVPAAVAAPTTTSAQAGLLRAVNAARGAHGLRALRLDPTLERAARAHSRDMLREHYFAHGDFEARLLAYHVAARTAGENLAWGAGAYGSPGAIVRAWLASPEHRANLLGAAYTRIGIGLVRGRFDGQPGTTVVTADFAGS
ncbi:MAG TPA: CAP domain-containing protein [Gaiellaceae bacterium]|nr:CAP domain-containing protein [Gaiellaceae bacterium]